MQSQQNNKQQFQKMEIQNSQQPAFQNQHQNQQIPVEQQIIQYQQLNEEEYQKYAQNVQQNSKKIIRKVISQNDPQDNQQVIQPVKNPISAYLIFTMKWKEENPNKKFNMSNLGEIWKNLEPHERRPFQQEFKRRKQKYDLYVASKLIKNPHAQKQEEVQNKFFFPLHRIRSIMKQDKFYAPKTQAVTAMARATQYFGEYFLQQMKKITQGKNRIDTKDLFECITVNQRIFGFLDCLIDDYTMSSKQKRSQKINNQVPQIQKQSPIKQSSIPQKRKPTNQQNIFSNQKPLPKGQIKLTDMFGVTANK